MKKKMKTITLNQALKEARKEVYYLNSMKEFIKEKYPRLATRDLGGKIFDCLQETDKNKSLLDFIKIKEGVK